MASTGFTRRRVIVMRHRGNLANKMLQYMGALTIARRIKNCEIVGVSIPEWGIELPDDTQEQRFFDNIDLWTWDAFRPHVDDIAIAANRSESIRIMLADHLQRMEFLMPRSAYHEVFPPGPVSERVADDDLLINVRAAELLEGVAHYPLMPISFYKEVVAKTRLRPLFVGQLNECEYVRRLRSQFPDARFINSLGPRADFDLIRSAKNIVIAVGTFSWLAAWLSEATTIFPPLNGFLNPSHHREIDLLPVEDVRYRFHLFPLNYGMSELESLQHHERMAGRWKEVSRNQVALIKTAAPLLRAPRENYNGGLPSRAANGVAIAFDSVWYAHQYIDAAIEISEGWFEDPLHHYLEVGRLRGYLPTAQLGHDESFNLLLPNIALNKSATQSSISEWSRGRSPETDAARALDGNAAKDYGFHTDREDCPWWEVDLGSVAHVHALRIFNRDSSAEWLLRRASPLIVEISEDREKWRILFRTKLGQIFGGFSSGCPLVWTCEKPENARFIRISIPRTEYLHLAEVEVYGVIPSCAEAASKLSPGLSSVYPMVGASGSSELSLEAIAESLLRASARSTLVRFDEEYRRGTFDSPDCKLLRSAASAVVAFGGVGVNEQLPTDLMTLYLGGSIIVTSCHIDGSASDWKEPVLDYERLMTKHGVPPIFVGKANEANGNGDCTVVAVHDAAVLQARSGIESVLPPIAIVAAYNEIDVISETIEELVRQGCDVVVIDNWSTDGTWETLQALAAMHGQQIRIERFPAAGPVSTCDWRDVLRRKESIACEFVGRWIIHADADEIRYSPFPDLTLAEGLGVAQRAGANRVCFTLLNFRPIDGRSFAGRSLRHHFKYFEFGDDQNHYKAWLQGDSRVDLATSGGHFAKFENIRDFPYRFPLQHYPIRSPEHGRRKVFQDREARWSEAERAMGWHSHYRDYSDHSRFVWSAANLHLFDERFWSEYCLNVISGIPRLRGGQPSSS